MKRIIFLLLTISVVLFIAGCSEKDSPTSVDVLGYSLDQFISKEVVGDSIDASAADSIDFRDLFNYEIVGADSDAWSPRLSINAGYDLGWDVFKSGYLVPSNNNRTWFADTNLPGAFRVRNTGLFRLYRKIDIVDGRSIIPVELKGLTVHQITNWTGILEDAIKLSDLLQCYASYDSVSIICYDEYGTGKYYSPAAVNDGYYLLESERTIFPTADIPANMKKMKKVALIKVFGGIGQSHSYQLAPHAQADLIFNKPASLSGYTATVLPL